jgi:8-oxo-dGTP diphosphatase
VTGTAASPAAAGPTQRPWAVGAVLQADGRVLMCRRTARRRWRPGAWDLPGGHVEAGETAVDALVRELREELAIGIAPPVEAPWRLVVPEFDMDVWSLGNWEGEVVNAAPREHAEIAWLRPGQIEALGLALPAYGPLIARALA